MKTVSKPFIDSLYRLAGSPGSKIPTKADADRVRGAISDTREIPQLVGPSGVPVPAEIVRAALAGLDLRAARAPREPEGVLLKGDA